MPYPGYGPVPVRPAVIQGNSGLGTAMLILGGVMVLSNFLAALAAPAASRAYAERLSIGYGSESAIATYGLTQILGGAAGLAVWIVGSLWLQRAYANAHALATRPMQHSLAWAWLGWIVPIVAFWFPKQILTDVWAVTRDPADYKTANHRQLGNLSWGLWIAYFLTFLLSHFYFTTTPRYSGAQFYGQSQTADAYHSIHPGLELLAGLVGVAALVAWALVVRGLSRAQDYVVARTAPAPWR